MTKARLMVAALLGLTVVLGAPVALAAGQVGLLDPGFGGDGKVTTNLDPPGAVMSLEDSANAVAVQPDGKIVLAGSLGCRMNVMLEECSMAIARYDTDGFLDGTFGGDGIVLTHFSSGAVGLDVALQDDGKIVVAGAAHAEASDEWAFALARYETDGTLDPTFSGDGRVKTWPGGQLAFGVAIQPDGKIVAAGDGIVRYTTDGSLDMGFGVGGHVDSPFMTDVAIQPDNRIVTSGFAFAKFGVYRYETDGTPDATFDGDGKATLAPGTGSAKANGLALQPNGKIVVAGAYRKEPGIRRFALGRLTASGAIDSVFGGGDGFVATRLGGQHSEARAVALQADGKIVVAGASWYGSPMQDNADVSSFAVARYTAAGALDRRFSGDGKIVTFLGNGFLFEQATSVALQPDRAIVVAGEASRHDGDFGVVRYVVPTSRPDAQIKQRSRPFFIGDDLYGPPASRQTWNANVRMARPPDPGRERRIVAGPVRVRRVRSFELVRRSVLRRGHPGHEARGRWDLRGQLGRARRRGPTAPRRSGASRNGRRQVRLPRRGALRDRRLEARCGPRDRVHGTARVSPCRDPGGSERAPLRRVTDDLVAGATPRRSRWVRSHRRR